MSVITNTTVISSFCSVNHYDLECSPPLLSLIFPAWSRSGRELPPAHGMAIGVLSLGLPPLKGDNRGMSTPLEGDLVLACKHAIGGMSPPALSVFSTSCGGSWDMGYRHSLV